MPTFLTHDFRSPLALHYVMRPPLALHYVMRLDMRANTTPLARLHIRDWSWANALITPLRSILR